MFREGKERHKGIADADKEKAKAERRSKLSWSMTWPSEGLGLSSFGRTFSLVLPSREYRDDRDFQRYIEHELSGRKGQAVGIEFGGPGIKLFSQFSKGFFKKSFGVTLVDSRWSFFRKPKEDPQHEVLVGDITADETYEKLEASLAGGKADLIIERMMSGWQFIAKDPARLGHILRRWYSLLNEGAVMFAQVPTDLAPLLEPWMEQVQKESGGTIEVQVRDGGKVLNESFEYGSSVFRLRKLAGAPAELPMLSRDTLRKVAEKEKSG